MSASSLPAISAAAPGADPAPGGPAGPGTRGPSAQGADQAQNNFDAHLHDARQQQEAQAADGDGRDADAPAKAPVPATPDTSTTKSGDGKPSHHHRKADGHDGSTGDGQGATDNSLAASVLGLIGQAAAPTAQAGADDEGVDALAATTAAGGALAGAAAGAGALPTAATLAAGKAAIQPKVLPGMDLGAAVGQADPNAKSSKGIADLDAKIVDKDADASGDSAKSDAQSAQARTDADATAANATSAPATGAAAASAGDTRDAFAAPSAKQHAVDAATASGGPLAAAAAPPSAQTGGTLHMLDIAAPAGTPGFAQELGEQIAWLGGQDVKQANIRLRPAELGQLDVKVSLSHGRVDVAFTAQHPAAVTAVQQTLGQLDLMLAGQGLSLGQAQVGQQGDGSPRGQSSGSGDQAGGEGETVFGTTPIRQQRPSGLLDAFA